MEELSNLISFAQVQYWFLVGAAITLGLCGLGLVAYSLLMFWRYKDRERYSLEMVLLEVTVPRDNEIKIDAAEQMFSTLHSIKKSGFWSKFEEEEHISLEIVALKEDIRFYISVPMNLRDMVEKQIHAAYPGAGVKEANEYNIFSEEGFVSFASLKLTGKDYLPINVYKNLPSDPLMSLTSTLAKMGDGEGAAIQIIVSPASEKWQDRGRQYISGYKRGEADPNKATYSEDPRKLEMIGMKTSKSGYRVGIRVVVSAPTKQMADLHLRNITGSFNQFSSEQNGFTVPRIWSKHMFMIDFIYRYRALFGRGESILNTEELATLYHFPNKTVETPHIKWLSSKTAPAPAAIPNSGLYLGKSAYRGISRKVYISEDDRRRHMYIVGKTGTGKSEFLKDQILQDIRAGKGVGVIDPHGELVDDILEFMPPERAEDVIYFDPSDVERPLGLNIMEAKTEDEKHFVVGSIINLMYKLYDPHKTGIIGPRFEHAIRNAMLTVMYEEGSTFIEVVRSLTDAKYVQELLPKVKDPVIRRYWTDQIAQTSDFHKSEVLDYIVSKFGRFVTNKMMRNIIGQSKSAFDFRNVMDEGKILLVNLSKGKIGEENSSFLGLILVPRILMAALSRQNMPLEDRKDFYLYVDEFQNFATPDFAVILSEARKYRLSLIVANQFLGQIEEEVKQAVIGNVGTVISFRVGVSDANFLQSEFVPTFNENDLTNVDRFNVFIKTIVNNQPQPPFSMDLTRDMTAEEKLRNKALAANIKELSRLKFGEDREVIEEVITRRAKL
jgi:hypothetical protein